MKHVIRTLSAFLLLLAAIVHVASILCRAEPETLLTSHVPDAVLNGEARLVGQLPATQTHSLRHCAGSPPSGGIENFLRKVYDPASPSYRHFVAVPEFTARFGPSQEDYDALIVFAKASGFKMSQRLARFYGRAVHSVRSRISKELSM